MAWQEMGQYSRVVTVLVAVVLIIQVLGLLLSMPFGSLTGHIVNAFGLDQFVDLGANGSSQQLLGYAVLDRISLFTLLLLPEAHALKSSS